jgi:dolichol-phosphate mannosyltransferase
VIFSKIKSKQKVILKFIVVSGSAVIINLVLLYILVKFFKLDDKIGENIANAISMEISIIYNYFMGRAITWRDRPREKGTRLLLQLLKFHLAIGSTLLFRLTLFPVLQHFGVTYIINAAIGIALSSILNFLIYDNYVFKKET